MKMDQGFRRAYARSCRNLIKSLVLLAVSVFMSGCATTTYISAPCDATDAIICKNCAGSGKVEVRNCSMCGGTGFTMKAIPGPYAPSYVPMPCRYCVGTKPEIRTCGRCKGTGRVYGYDSSGNRLPPEKLK